MSLADLIQEMKQKDFDLDGYKTVIEKISLVLSTPLGSLLRFGFAKLMNLADPNRHGDEPSQMFGTGKNPLCG